MLKAQRKCILRAVILLPGLMFVPPFAAQAKDDATMELDKKVFIELAEPQCAICHTLKDAGSEGEIGPILDELKPTEEQVEQAVRSGLGVMPAFENLTDEEILAVSKYVAEVAGK
jgi:mono/diheme cytochrome c family protein